MPRRLLASLTAFLLVALVLAPGALAANNGRGFYGESRDIAVTNTGFILIIFFPLFIFTMSMLQWRLDKRKAARKAAVKSLSANGEWHGGW